MVREMSICMGFEVVISDGGNIGKLFFQTVISWKTESLEFGFCRRRQSEKSLNPIARFHRVPYNGRDDLGMATAS